MRQTGRWPRRRSAPCRKAASESCDSPKAPAPSHSGPNRPRSMIFRGLRRRPGYCAPAGVLSFRGGSAEHDMILPKILALGAQLMIPVVDSVPTLNVEQVCTGIAQQGGVTFHDSAITQEKKDCLNSEQGIRDELVKQWPSFNGSDKVHCTNESTMGGESSYTDLLTCLEMARVVGAMRTAEPQDAMGTPLGPPKPKH